MSLLPIFRQRIFSGYSIVLLYSKSLFLKENYRKLVKILKKKPLSWLKKNKMNLSSSVPMTDGTLVTTFLDVFSLKKIITITASFLSEEMPFDYTIFMTNY